MIASFESKRNELNVAVSTLIGEWVLIGLDADSSLPPMWNADNQTFFRINEDRTFRLWYGDSQDDPERWFIDGEITPDGENGYNAVALRMLNNPLKNLSTDDMIVMQLQYDDSGPGTLYLVITENSDRMMFTRTTDTDFTPLPTPQTRP